MHSSVLLTSALAVSALALPNQLEKRQLVTVYNTVTVTVTVFANPYTKPAWTAPQFSQTPNTLRPANAPPLWTPPRVGVPTRASSATSRSSSTTSPAVGPGQTSIPAVTPPVVVPPFTPPVVVPPFTPPVVVPPFTPPVVAPVSTPANTPPVVAPVSTPGNTPPVVGPISNTPSPPIVGLPSVVPSISLPGPGTSGVIGTPISAAPSVGVPGVSPSSGPAAPSVTPAPPSAGTHISGPSQATLSVGLEYQRAILYHHNAARANHGAAPLVWNDTVAATAAIAANTCRFEHLIPQGANQGQNLFTVSGSAFNVTAGITESWYKGELSAMLSFFGVAIIPDVVFHDVGHLTQVLWKGTTQVGCVSIDCGNRMVVGGVSGSSLNKYTVCNYAPAGNIYGQYAINVGRPLSTSPAALGSWSD